MTKVESLAFYLLCQEVVELGGDALAERIRIFVVHPLVQVG